MDSMQLATYLEKYRKNMPQKVVKVQSEIIQEIQDELKVLAPFKNGNYMESITKEEPILEGKKISSRVYSDLEVTTTRGKSYNLGFLLENGTESHIILPYFASALHFYVDGKEVFATKVNHPGTQPQPHWLPTFEKYKPIYMQKLKEALHERVNTK